MPFVPLSRTGWTATATASDGSHPPSLAIDGDLGTYWWTGSGIPQSISVDCGTAQTFDSVAFQPSTSFGGDRPTGCSVYVSDDGISWGSPVGSGSGLANDATVKAIQFPGGAVTKRYFRLTVTASTGGWTQVGDLNAGTLSPATDVRATQGTLEWAGTNPPTAAIRETQAALEHVLFPPNAVWQTQACLEVLFSAAPPTGVRNYAYTGGWART